MGRLFVSDAGVVDPIPSHLDWGEVTQFIGSRLAMFKDRQQADEQRYRQQNKAWVEERIEKMGEKTKEFSLRLVADKIQQRKKTVQPEQKFFVVYHNQPRHAPMGRGYHRRRHW